jgi:hypothetical protein
MHKVLISSKKDDSLDTCKTAICDPVDDIYFEDVTCKKFVEQHLGFYCQICLAKNQLRKFPSLKALEEHLDR